MNHSNAVKHIILLTCLLHGAPIQPYSFSDAWLSIRTALSTFSYKLQAMCALTVITITVLLCNAKKKPSDRHEVHIRPERQQIPQDLEEKQDHDEQPGAVQDADAAQVNELIIDAIDARASKDEMCALIARSPDINSPDTIGNLPLQYASGERYYEAMEALLKAGADVNKVDVWGWTPLRKLLDSYEGLNERPQLQLLLDYGADWSDIHYGTLRPGLRKFFKKHITKEFDDRACIRTDYNRRRHSIGSCTELDQHEGVRCIHCWNTR